MDNRHGSHVEQTLIEHRLERMSGVLPAEFAAEAKNARAGPYR